MQVSSEYVAYNLHYLSQLSGGLKPAIIAHSQGGPVSQWALQYWPSTGDVTSAFIPLSPDFDGVNLLGSDLDKFCIGELCQASLWQQSDGSHYMDALHRRDFNAQVPTTVVWTKTDFVVNPPKRNAQLPGSTVISVQSLCPLRLATHTDMTTDAAVFAIALDALRNGGTASLARVRKSSLSACFRTDAPNMSGSVKDSIEDSWNSVIDGYM